MNILIYFKADARQQMLEQVNRFLYDDGIIIAGTNGLGAQTRYAVYQKDHNRLTLNQFAFTLDNLGHLAIMPWMTMHEDDPEALLLADCSKAIRSDRSFWPGFSNRLDALLQHHGICRRQADGYLKFPGQIIPPPQYMVKNGIIWQQLNKEDYTDRAVDVLKRAGYDAWKNRVGDIAVRPEKGLIL